MHTPTFIHAHTEAKWDLHRIIIQNIWQTLKIVIKIFGNLWACFLTFLCLRQTLISTFIPSSAYKNTPRKTRNISEESLLFTLRFCVSHKFTQNWSFYDVSVFDDIFKTSEDFWKFFWLRVIGASILPISYHSSSLFHSFSLNPADRILQYLTYFIHFLSLSSFHLYIFWIYYSEIVAGIEPETMYKMNIFLGKIKYNCEKYSTKYDPFQNQIVYVSQTSGGSVVVRGWKKSKFSPLYR